ncbi:hypothetical protein [Aeromonas sp. Marseille-Q7275]
MSGAKRLIEEQEAKRSCAVGIAIEAGSAKRCWVHDDVLIEGEPEGAALEYGVQQFNAGELAGIFDDIDDMEEHVRQVVGETAECCYKCDDPD